MKFFDLRGRRRPSAESNGIWIKSSFSSYTSNCVEVAGLGTGTVRVRDSKNPRAGILSFSPAEWNAFLGDVRNGEFDHKPR